MNENKTDNDVQELQTSSDKEIRFGSVKGLDLEGLDEEAIRQLQVKHAEGLIDLNKKAQELKVDVGALEATLTSMSGQTRQIAEDGNSVTMTHTQDTTLGRTEVIMGNTDKAAKGKLSRSQTGGPDNTLIYLAVGAVVIIVLAIALSK